MVIPQQTKNTLKHATWIFLGVMALILAGGAAYVMKNSGGGAKNQQAKTDTVVIPLDELAAGQQQLPLGQVSVNGELRVNGSLFLKPSARPQNAVRGQAYVDDGDSTMYVYDGSNWQPLGGSQSVAASIASIQGVLARKVDLQANLGPPQSGSINISGVVGAGSFQGNGSGLTGLNADNVSQGTLSDLRLSGNVALLDRTDQTFTGATSFTNDSIAALRIQNAAGTSPLFIADTINNRIGIGQAPTATGAMLQVSGGIQVATATLPAAGAAMDGSLVYDASAGRFKVYENGLVKTLCNATDGCFSAAVTLQGAYDNSATPATITTTSTTKTLVFKAGVGFDSSSLFQVQNAAGTGVMTIDTISGKVIATNFQGNGALLTSLNASNVSGGTLADARLSSNVTLLGNTFNGANQLVMLDGVGALPVLNAAALTNLNAANIATGTLNDARLSTNVTVQGNTFNGAGQLVQLTLTGDLPALNGSLLTNLNGSNITSGTVNDARLSSNVTLQGNIFNGTNQLVQLNNLLQLPAVSGALVTNLNATALTSGTVNDARLSVNVTLQGNTFNGANQLVQLNNLLQLPAVSGALVTNLSASNVASGTLNDARLSSNVALLGRSNQVFTGNQTVFKNTANATDAFAVQDTTGTAIFTVDTTNGKVVVNTIQGNGSLLTNLDASNLAIGTVADARLSANVTLQGNTFNGANQLVKLDGLSALPVVSGANLTNLNASSITTGTLADARLTANVTLQGNTFNGANQLVKLDASGNLPALDGSALTNLNASNITSGVLGNARLSSTVAQLTRNGQTFTGNQQLFQNATNSTTAFRIQDSSGANLLIADTTNNRLKVGDGADATPTLFVVDSVAGSLPTGVSGGIIYDTSAGKFKVFENGSYKTLCNTSDLACGNQPTTTLQDAYNNSADPALVVTTSTGKTITFKAGGGFDSTSLFSVQDSADVTQFAVDTVNSQVTLTNLLASGTVTANAFVGNGANITNIYANNIATGTLNDARLSSNVTLQGNSFNGSNQLVQLNNLSQLPSVSGALLNNLNASSLASGTVNDARLSSNVALLNRNGQTFTGNQQLFQNLTDSTTAFRIQNAAGTTTLFTADTTNNRLGLGAGTLLTLGTTTTGNFPTGVNGGLIYNSSTDELTVYANGSYKVVCNQTDGNCGGPGGGATLQSVYDLGNSITTTNARNIAFTLADNVTDANFVVNVASGSTGQFLVQQAGSNALAFNSANNRIVIGDQDNTSQAATTLFVVDSASTANLPNGVNGGIVYDTSVNHFKVYENGQYKELCNQVDGNCGGAGGGGTLQSAYNTGNTITATDGRDVSISLPDTTTDPNFIIDIAATSTGKLSVRSGGAETFSVNGTGQVVVKNATNSTTGFQVQNSSGNASLVVDTTNRRVGVGQNGAPSATLQVTGSGSVDLLKVTDNTSVAADVFRIMDEGATIFRNRTDSATAFRIQNAAGTDLINVNTTTGQVTISGLQATGQDITVTGTVTAGFFSGNGSNLTNLNASAISTGTLNDARLSSNVALLNANNIFTATNTFRTATNSTTGFLIQNSTGGNVLVVDTINGGIGINRTPGSTIALDVTGVIRASSNIQTSTQFNLNNSAVNNGFISKTFTANANLLDKDVVVLNTSNARATISSTARDSRVLGVASGDINSGTTGGIAISGNYSVRADTGAVAIGDQLVVSSFTDVSRSAGGYVTVDNNATSGIVGYAMSTKAAGATGLISVYIRPNGGQQTPVFRSATDSTSALQIQNSAGTSNLFVADTTNTRIAIGQSSAAYTLDVNGDINTTGTFRVNGTALSSSNLSDSSNLAKLNGTGPQVFSGNNQFNGSLTANGAGTGLSVSNNAVIGGTLNVTGATVLGSTLQAGSSTLNSLTVTNNALVSGTLSVTGDVNINSNKFTIVAASGNTTVAGTLGVTGAVSLSNTLGVTGDFSINTNKFTVTAANGNTLIAGTLGVTGATTLTGQLNANGGIVTNNANINAGTGSITSGTINGQTISSTANFTGTVTADGNINSVNGGFQTGGTTRVDNAGNLVNIGNVTATGTALFKNASNSTTAFQIQNAAGTSNLLIADTTNTRIAIAKTSASYTLDVGGDINTTGTFRVNGTALSSSNLSDASNIAYLNGTGPQTFTGNNKFTGTVLLQNAVDSSSAFAVRDAANSKVFEINTVGGGSVGAGNCSISSKLYACAASSLAVATFSQGGSGNILQLQNSGNNLVTVGSTGNTLFKNSVDSTTAFQVQNAAGTTNVFTVDTSNGRVGINTASPNNTLQVNGNAQAVNLILNSGTTGALMKNYAVGTGGVTGGDVVIMADDSGVARAMVTTTIRDTRVFGVAQGTTASGGVTGIQVAGSATVNADTAAINIGDQLVTSATAGRVTVDNNATTGILGYALTAKAAGSTGTVSVRLQIQTGQYSPTFGTLKSTGSTLSVAADGVALDDPTDNLLSRSGASNLSNASIVSGAVTRTNLGGGKWRYVSNGGVNATVRLYVNLADLTNGTTYAASVYYENKSAGSMFLDWSDQGTVSTTAASGRISTAGSRATYDASYRFMDVAIPDGMTVDLYYPQVEQKNAATAYTPTARSAGDSLFWGNSINLGKVLLQNGIDSTTAFQIQNAAGTSNLLVADTTNTRIGIGGLPANGLLTVGTNTTAASGGIYFGTDTNLYRSAADTLATDDNLVVGTAGSSTTLTVNGSLGTISTSTTGNNLNFSRAGSNYITATNAGGTLNFGAGGTIAQVTLSAAGNLGIGLQPTNGQGLLQLASGTTAANGIAFGADTNLYRSAADTLKTDDSFIAGNSFVGTWTGLSGYAAFGQNGLSGTTASYALLQDGGGNTFLNAANTKTLALRIANVSKLDITSTSLAALTTGKTAITIADSGAQNSGITIGGDTNLYRSAADTLKTDDSLVVGGGFSVSGTAASEIRPDNLLPDGGFEYGGQHITLNGASTILNDSTNAHSGNRFVRMTPNGSFQNNFTDFTYQVQPGDVYYYEYWVKADAGTNGWSRINFNMCDKDRANCAWTNPVNTVPGTSWTKVSGTITVPASMSYMNISQGATHSASTTGNYYFDDFFVQRVDRVAPMLINGDSTAAFQIQNSSAQTLFVADTANQRLAVGPAAVAANGILTIGTNTTTTTGGIYFGTDTNLYRWGSNALRTDGSFYAGGYVQGGGNSGRAFRVGNDVEIYDVDVANTLRIQGTSDATTATIQFGSAGDTNLYRVGADSLKTDDAFTASGGLFSKRVVGAAALNAGVSGDVQAYRFAALAEGTLQWSDGTNPQDTNLYRSAANTLKTDDAFIATGNIYANAKITVGFGGGIEVWSGVDGTGTRIGSINRAAAAGDVAAVMLLQGEAGRSVTIQGGTAGDASLIVQGLSGQTGNLLTVRNYAQSTVGAINSVGQLQLSVQGNTGGLLIGGDTNLYRSAADMLKTDDSLTVATNAYVGASTALGNGTGLVLNGGGAVIATRGGSQDILQGAITGDAFARIAVNAGGLIQFGSGSATPDITLSRTSAGTLTTTSFFQAASGIFANNGSAGQVRVGTGTTTAEILFGSAGDTNLYRSAADTLKTDDSLVVGNNLTVTNTANATRFTAVTTSGNTALSAAVTGDSASRLAILGSGTLQWGDGINPQDTNLYRSSAGVLGTNNTFGAMLSGGASAVYLNPAGYADSYTSSVTAPSLAGRVTGDSQSRFVIRADGQIQWGDGTNAKDTNLYRSAADTLKTDDNFTTAGLLTVAPTAGAAHGQGLRLLNGAGGRAWELKAGSPGVNNNYFTLTDITASNAIRLTMDDNGRLGLGGITAPSAALSLQGGTTAAEGIAFGGDTNLYRVAADSLKTDDTFTANGLNSTASTTQAGLRVTSPGTNYIGYVSYIGAELQGRFVIRSEGVLQWGDGTNAVDTNLYRSAADTLKTDDALIVSGNFTNNGSALFRNSANSTTAFQVQTAGGSTLLNVDTVNGVINTGDLAGSQITLTNGTSGIALRPVLSSGSVTQTGGLITDETRATSASGDGRSQDSSTGIWEPTTNLVANGGIETNTTGWTGDSGSGLSRSTARAKFGAASMKVVTTGSPQATHQNFTVSPSTTYTVSLWVYREETTANLQFRFTDAGTTATLASSTVPAVRGWQRLTLTATTLASGTTAWLSITNTSAGVPATFYIDGAQAEQLGFATPYIDTNGSTAARSGAKIDVPTSTLDLNQGWIAMRARMGASSSALTNDARLFDARTAGNGIVAVARWEAANGRWSTQAPTGPVVTDSFAAGDMRTFIFKWDATNAGFSVNGAAFTNAARGALPSDIAAFTIGAYNTSTAQFNGDVLWSAVGTGTLSDADAATIAAMGNNDPALADMPSASLPTFGWDGVGTTYEGTNATPRSTLTLDDVTLYRSAANTLKTEDNLVVSGTALFQNSVDSINAFKIQNAAGTSNSFVVDTLNDRVGIGVAPTVAGPKLMVRANTDQVVVNIQGNSTQTNNLLQLQDSNSNILAKVTAAGNGSFADNGQKVVIGQVVSGNAGLLFGSTGDVNLYRSAADTLRTDDALIISNSATNVPLQVSGDATSVRYIEIKNTGNNQAGVRWVSGSTPLAWVAYLQAPTDSWRLWSGTLNADALTVASNGSVTIGTDGGGDRTATLQGATTGQNLQWQTRTNYNAIVSTGTNSFVLSAAGNQIIAMQTNGVERVRIDQNGLVGVGMTPLTSMGILQAAGNISAFTANTDANPQVTLGRNGSTGGFISFGIGGASGTDVTLRRSAVSELRVDSGSLEIDNTLYFGSGKDTNLYRSAADTLKTDDALIVTNALTVGQTISVTSLANAGVIGYTSRYAGNTTNPFAVYADGKLEWGDGTNARDANLYRSAANRLQTDGSLFTGAQLRVNQASSTNRVDVGLDLTGTNAAAISFSTDTNLYRSAADTLKTDDSFVAGASITSAIGQTGQISLTTPSGRAGILFGNSSANQTDLVNTATGELMVRPRAGGTTPSMKFIIQGGGTQSGVDLFQVQNSSGTILTAFDSSGKLVFGPSGSQDTNLYRGAADQLKTDDSLFINAGNAGYLKMQGASGAAGYIQAAAGTFNFVNNAFWNGSNWIYDTTAAASSIQLTNGTLGFYTAGSGTAGTTATFNSALAIANTGAATFASTITGTTLNGTTGINTGAGSGAQRIDASGNLVNISTATLSTSITIGNTGGYQLNDTGATNRYVLKRGGAGSLGGSNDLMLTNRAAGGDTIIGANSGAAGGEVEGLRIANTTGAAKFKNASDSTTGFQVQTSGNATLLGVDTQNSKIGIGAAPATTGATAQIQGTASGVTALSAVADGATVITVNRNTSDGVLVDFQRDGSTVGDISVASGTVSYNAFTGSHYGKSVDQLSAGELVSQSGGYTRTQGEMGEPIYDVRKSSLRNDPTVMGAYLAGPDGNRTASLIAAVGNADIWVVDNGKDLAIGDYLISSDTAGHAELDTQTEPVSHVIAKVAEPVSWASVTDTVDGKKRKKVSVFFTFFDRGGASQLQGVTGDQGAVNQGLSGDISELKVTRLATINSLIVLNDADIKGNVKVGADLILSNDRKGTNFQVEKGKDQLKVQFAVPEPDENFNVQITPQWRTDVWVTDKTATGFVIHFGNSVPEDGKIDWIITR